MRKVILLFILITTVLRAWADGTPTLTAVAPDVVVSGDQFRLTYTVNTQKVRAVSYTHLTLPTTSRV